MALEAVVVFGFYLSVISTLIALVVVTTFNFHVYKRYQSFCASERFQPPGQAATFLKVKGREAWVVQRLESDGEEACRKLPPPMDEVMTSRAMNDRRLNHHMSIV